MATHGISKKDLATNCAETVLAVEELYRCERVFILQPQRVVLDERYRRLRSEYRGLVDLLSGNKQQTESARIDDLVNEQLRLIAEFKAELDAAGEIHDYSNYRANC
jgi:hypothetical protein